MEILLWLCLAAILFAWLISSFAQWNPGSRLEKDERRLLASIRAKQLRVGRDHPNCRCHAGFQVISDLECLIYIDQQVREVLDGIPDFDKL